MKKNQHYVWKHYLKPWSINGKIWTRRAGRVFATSLDNVAQERFFYETFKFGATELLYIKGLIDGAHPSGYAVLHGALELYLSTTHGDSVERKTKLEDYHSHIEGRAIEFFDSIRSKNYSFLENKKRKAEFCYFVGLQITRTKRMYERIYASLKRESQGASKWPKNDNSNLVNLAKALQVVTAEFYGNWLTQAQIKFVSTIGEKQFLTCDQPAFNMSARPEDLTTPPTEMKIFYPVSPETAMLASNESIQLAELSDADVERYNAKIFTFSHEFIFSMRPSELRPHSG